MPVLVLPFALSVWLFWCFGSKRSILASIVVAPVGVEGYSDNRTAKRIAQELRERGAKTSVVFLSSCTYSRR